MDRFRGWVAFAALVFPTLPAAPAGASPVALGFTGVLTSVNDPQRLLPAPVVLGTGITGTLSYETGASCLPVTPTTCEYLPSSATLRLSLGATQIASVNEEPQIYVTVGPPLDSFSANFNAPAASSGGSGPVWLNGDLQFTDPTSSTLRSTALPTALDLTRFAQGTFDASGGNPQDPFLIKGTILTVQLVPEPATGVLLAVGLLALRGWGGTRVATRRRLAPEVIRQDPTSPTQKAHPPFPG